VKRGTGTTERKSSTASSTFSAALAANEALPDISEENEEILNLPVIGGSNATAPAEPSSSVSSSSVSNY
jgi:hypothetical protein